MLLLKTKLETSAQVGKLHSKRVHKLGDYTRNECTSWETTLETSEKVEELHSTRVLITKYFFESCAFIKKILILKLKLFPYFTDADTCHFVNTLNSTVAA